MKIPRRSFLKQVSALSAAPFILPSHVWAADTKPNDLITIGFIGTGKQGRYLMEAFLQHKRCRVVAVCDVDTTRREDTRQRAADYYAKKSDRKSTRLNSSHT